MSGIPTISRAVINHGPPPLDGTLAHATRWVAAQVRDGTTDEPTIRLFCSLLRAIALKMSNIAPYPADTLRPFDPTLASTYLINALLGT